MKYTNTTQPYITPSEEKVMLLAWKGHTRKEIATRLHRSEFTIQTHERNIFVKLGVQNKAEMFRYMEDNIYRVNTEPIKQRIRAILCIALVLGIELGIHNTVRTKAPSAARVAKVAKGRARRVDSYEEDKTYQYVA